MVYLALALVILLILLSINLYLDKKTHWVMVFDVTCYRAGDYIEFDNNHYKVTDVDFVHNKIQVRPTIMQFIGGIFWRS